MLLRWLLRPSVYEKPQSTGPARKGPANQRHQQHVERHALPAADPSRLAAALEGGDESPVPRRSRGDSTSSRRSGAPPTVSTLCARPSSSTLNTTINTTVTNTAGGAGSHTATDGDHCGINNINSNTPPHHRQHVAPSQQAHHPQSNHAHPPTEAECASDGDVSEEDDEYAHGIPTSDSFRGGRVHFFRQVPHFFLHLEGFLAFTGMCLAQTVLESVMAPFRMLLRRFRLRDVLATFYVMCGVASLYLATPSDSRLYSSVYHVIRASSTIKLYVIFNMLELADKLLSAFNTDVVETTWVLIKSRTSNAKSRRAQSSFAAGSSGGLSDSSSAPPPPLPPSAPSGGGSFESRGGLLEILFMLVMGSVSIMLHTIVLLCHVATINVAVNSEGSSLIGLLISNNFVEVKSIVFKKNTPESLLTVVSQDAVEGVQHMIFITAMLMQHVLTSEGPGSLEMGQIALIIFCEIAIDFIKHIFVARFNCIRLEVYRSFLHTCFLDVSLRRFLAATRLPVVTSYTFGKTDLVGAMTTGDLSHAHFIPNPAHRAAFVPFPYASLLLWAAWPAVSATLGTSPLTALLCLLLLLSINAFLKTFTLSWAAAHTYSIIRREQRAGHQHHQPSAPSSATSTLVPGQVGEGQGGTLPSTAVHAKSLSHNESISNHSIGATPAMHELVGPLLPPPAMAIDAQQQPNPSERQVHHSNSSHTPAPSAAARPRMYVVVDAFTQSLLDVDRFDLQAGKKKK